MTDIDVLGSKTGGHVFRKLVALGDGQKALFFLSTGRAIISILWKISVLKSFISVLISVLKSVICLDFCLEILHFCLETLHFCLEVVILASDDAGTCQESVKQCRTSDIQAYR